MTCWKRRGSPTLQRKSSSVAVMAGCGRIEWYITRIAGSAWKQVHRIGNLDTASRNRAPSRLVCMLAIVYDRVLVVSYNKRTRRHAGAVYKVTLELHRTRAKVLQYLHDQMYVQYSHVS